jgi:hypothetical protein
VANWVGSNESCNRIILGIPMRHALGGFVSPQKPTRRMTKRGKWRMTSITQRHTDGT